MVLLTAIGISCTDMCVSVCTVYEAQCIANRTVQRVAK